MELNFRLTGKVKEVLQLKAGEEIKYSVPYDIDESGRLTEDGYIIVTNLRLFIIKGTEITYQNKLAALEKIKCEPMVNNGLLVVKEYAEDYEKYLARFTMHHMVRISLAAKGIERLLEHNDKEIRSNEREKTCLKCGRALPGTRICPNCDGKQVTAGKFWGLIKYYKLQLVFMALVAIISSALSLYIPQFQKPFIDNILVTKNGTSKDILSFFSIMLFFTVVQILVQVVKNWWFVYLGARISMDIRARMYEKIQELTLSFILDKRPGELMNRVAQDTRKIQRFMQECFGHMFSCLITMTGAIGIMLALDVKMTLVSVVFLPLVYFISGAFRKNIHRRFHLQWVKSDKLNSSLQDVISGIRVVKSFGKEKEESEKFNHLTEEYAAVQSRNEVFWASLYPVLTFIMSMGIYFVLYFGGIKVLDGNMTVGTLMQFNAYAWILYGPLGWMTHLPRMITEMVTSLERIYDVLDEEPLILNKSDAVQHSISGEIEFKNVSFGYKSYEPVLKNIDLHIKKGEYIGLVGASGTGKSTMINLIMHLYEADDGDILIDGRNIKELDLEHYHSQLGVVLQETFLFSGSILNNIRFAKPEASMEEIIQAAKAANAHDFICKTPDGYNTYVGEHGYNLSGGERQRIAIARAILNNPGILILDEATSSLDTESEYLIQKALERLSAGRTTLAIAHRLSTLRRADRLIVIDGHSIAETGSHNELMEQQGIYYNLVTAQLQMQSLQGQKS
ncbi:ABC transporter ATP-binding protein [Anaerocolumna sp. AGMB13020]|uniref:ABC transporter ATP-binding protein n=1 Tax=Anaerocolumna sp. AGMB13020 TaxID=3081750 RepID=UPI0029557DCE|nr:ABC transporter ATP-binding protein [Anaerocolumna sp. AGMB13020]WOO38227.1 ABC transporter ATP-binding protein [Anaerocolumna sp. AGMB13020]